MKKAFISAITFLLLITVQSIHSFAQLQVIDSLESLLSKTTSDTAKLKLLNNIAKQYWGKDPDKAISYSEKALVLEDRIRADYTDEHTIYFLKQERSRALVSLGVVNLNRGSYTDAMLYFNKALKLREELNDKKGVASVHNNIGLIYWNQANYEKALVHQLKALQIREELKDKEGLAASYNNIGLIYIDVGNLDKALEYHLNALKMNEELGVVDEIAGSLNNIGIIYTNRQQYDKALACYRRSYELTREHGSKRSLTTAYSNLGTIFRYKKDYDSAMICFKHAMQLGEEMGDKLSNAQTIAKIGKLYSDQGKTDLAIQYNKDAIKLFVEINSLEDVKDCDYLLMDLYREKKDYKNALDWFEQYSHLKDSIALNSSASKINQVQMEYEFEKRQKEQELFAKMQEQKVAADRKQERLVRNFFIGGFVIMLLFAFFIFRSLQQNRKAKTIIEQQQKETMDSINYAKRIQKALLPTEKYIGRNMNRLNDKK